MTEHDRRKKPTSSVGALLGGFARDVAERAAKGAVDGVKREYAADAAGAALKALDEALKAADAPERRRILASMDLLRRKHEEG